MSLYDFGQITNAINSGREAMDRLNATGVGVGLESRDSALMSSGIVDAQLEISKNRSSAFIWGIHRWGSSVMKVAE